MRTPDIHSLKHCVNKWLFALILLASVFAFSGPGTSPRTGPSPVQTSWIIRDSKPVIKGIHYSIRRQDLSGTLNPDPTSSSIANLCGLHSKTDAVRLKLCRRVNLLNARKMFTGILKTIPQNGKAELSPVVA
jgi:hypothetical protein